MEREQVLRIEENGNICMEISSAPLLHGSKARRDSGSDKSESPVVPVVREHNNGGKVRIVLKEYIIGLIWEIKLVQN